MKCLNGEIQARLVYDPERLGVDEGKVPPAEVVLERLQSMGIKDPKKKYEIEDMVRGDCLFAATGVTTGSLLSGVKFRKDVIETETVVMRSVTGTVRYIKAEHRQLDKFHLD